MQRLTLVIMLSVLLLCGCYDYRETDDLTLVGGIALDKAEEEEDGRDSGLIKITVETADIREEGKIKEKIIEAYGDSLQEAIDRSTFIAGKEPNWSHAQIVVMGREYASSGLFPLIRYITADRAMRINLNLLVAREEGGEILKAKSITNQLQAFQIYTLINSDSYYPMKQNTCLFNLINSFADPSQSPVLPALKIVENDREKAVELDGVAVFNGDRLVGFLADDDAKFVFLLRDAVKKMLIPLDNQAQAPGRNRTFMLLDYRLNIKPRYNGDQWEFEIELDAGVDLGNTEGNKAQDNSPRDAKKEEDELKGQIELQLSRRIQEVVHKVQNDFGVDIFGLGNRVRRSYPKLWQDYADNWPHYFRECKINPKVQVTIKNSGLTRLPLNLRGGQSPKRQERYKTPAAEEIKKQWLKPVDKKEDKKEKQDKKQDKDEEDQEESDKDDEDEEDPEKDEIKKSLPEEKNNS